ncbi:phosphatidate cytidylyltransferase [Schinkia azotoformans]|uniref:Phosphatidate cytidylyltransferase n=1 Tax=Schinkia azotoformans LMG 9581 TaxID=1131731 RepID=K6DT06_SCHAZ|nr:phosphatidate cytidylyltransferase [Schinkia azotoformans]EKN63916.1 phosphatidate cytidylyltransferase [Schinkia azotoformans LMG 9581]MEC1638220.1 phosphatidate cytidylyltransferase [Schinkia azotoformans]MEC1721892.1 phosphatidate cytidylyltransferase [Schinkia azotoformans]MEC1946346.1 phosphatidate cytidylyltransferase [Schinkia azotoformans]MED4351806.1 phosphatidate cytidylyltransferase [Schinkia azotoformans]
MKTRILTAIIAAAIFLPLVIIGETPFVILVYLLGTIALKELLRMKKIRVLSLPGLIGFIFLWVLLIPHSFLIESVGANFSKIEAALIVVMLLLIYTVISKNEFTFDDAGFIILSTVYVGVGFYYLIETRMAGLSYVFFALFVIWATDSGAYFIGRAFGKRKLWPEISPNKTVAGFVGGVLSALLVGLIFQIVSPLHPSLLFVLVVTVVTSLFGQMGDLVESALKRHFTVKDSGHILPGHGGILDRFDSLLFVLPILHFLQFI